MMPSRIISQLFQKLQRPALMGVLNVTPDSFSDGGKFLKLDDALRHAEKMVTEGADIIDVGGESTRPGAITITPEEELARVLPVIQALRQEFPIPLSIDTSQPLVMRECALAGVNIINDARSFKVSGSLEAVANTELPIILYHMQGEPGNMQKNPQYSHVVNDIKQFFIERIQACENAGISRDRICIDPGFAFGKTYQHNFQLLANLNLFHDLHLPLCVGMSRKTFIRMTLNCDARDTLYGNIATAVIAAQQQVAIIRVHEVKPTLDAIKIVQAMQQEGRLS